jgi:hypothetical protein
MQAAAGPSRSPQCCPMLMLSMEFMAVYRLDSAQRALHSGAMHAAAAAALLMAGTVPLQ